MQLCRAFILPYFQYCSVVWHFCGRHNSDNLELLNIQALRLVLNDYTSRYSSLPDNLDMVSLKDTRIQDHDADLSS